MTGVQTCALPISTSENIARIIFEKLAPAVAKPGIKLDRVRICESPTSGATYRPDDL